MKLESAGEGARGQQWYGKQQQREKAIVNVVFTMNYSFYASHLSFDHITYHAYYGTKKNKKSPQYIFTKTYHALTKWLREIYDALCNKVIRHIFRSVQLVPNIEDHSLSEILKVTVDLQTKILPISTFVVRTHHCWHSRRRSHFLPFSSDQYRHSSESGKKIWKMHLYQCLSIDF